MGMYPAPTKCFITGSETLDIPSSLDVIEYSISIGDRIQSFTFSSRGNWKSSVFLKKNGHILKSFVILGEWDIPQSTCITEETLSDFLKTKRYPKNPEEKYEYFFMKLFEMQTFEGEKIEIERDHNVAARHFFRNIDEYAFYLRSFEADGLIELTSTNSGDLIQITYAGLNYALKLKTEGEYSNRCFIAMSFSENMQEIRQAFKEVCEDLGYQPVLIDEIHLESSQTINDGIIAEIKKSKFMCADFTEQKDGVYFESGFALGQNKQVIYSCHADWFSKTHFDTNHFPHIIYNTPDELRSKLKAKIQAWVN